MKMWKIRRVYREKVNLFFLIINLKVPEKKHVKLAYTFCVCILFCLFLPQISSVVENITSDSSFFNQETLENQQSN